MRRKRSGTALIVCAACAVAFAGRRRTTWWDVAEDGCKLEERGKKGLEMRLRTDEDGWMDGWMEGRKERKKREGKGRGGGEGEGE